MGKFELKAASGRCMYVPDSKAGLVQMNYYGVVDAAALVSVREATLQYVQHAPALVIRTDTALIAMSEVPPVTWRPGTVPPAAIIVRAETRDLWMEYARQLAQIEIMRVVFLESQAEQAYRWADRMAEQRGGLWLPGRPGKP